MSSIDLNGIFPPVTTPFVDDQVAYDKLAANVEKYGRTGLKGIVVLGSNGEYVSLSEAEKRKVVETVVQATPDHMSVIAGTGCESTRETIRLTADCAAAGAHAALVVTPHYFGGKMSDAALIKHFTTVADNSPIPVLLYNVPQFTHVNLTVNVVAELSGHPNIIGIKDSTGNVMQLGEFLGRVDAGFSILVGTASALYGALTLGCVGGVLALANVTPDTCVQIQTLIQQGDFKAAQQIQLKMIPVNKAVTAVYGIAGLKSALDMLGYFGGEPRAPLLPSTDEAKTAIENILKQAGLLE
ncbi:MAG: dihydrodipicolinate synthase family protein [Deltaproteobacteria bacterium]|jgi:4-hydroxy-2-oxoglutarate aldolase|nr:dihydrodipicolinate synthase family protein [Deltaproteobacteria bacterium]MBW2479596.1 dihydrodipicolinate synthase family protein [Deltaproteobacteria bacterium]